MRVSFTVVLDEFEALSANEQQDVYLDALWSLINENAAWLKVGRRFASGFPRLYDAGIRFAISEEEKSGREPNLWPNIPAILRVGHAHCVGLACWRIAELRVRDNVDARPAVAIFQEVRDVGRVDEFHICVRFPDGTIEDPSALLGMPT